MPKFTAKVGPRKSNTGTPVPGGGDDLPTLADKLNYADLPRPFKQQSYVSKLPYRTASTSTTGVKKNVKQILTLERERVSGGDGFLTASQTAARARGEVVEPAGSKKKKTGPGAGGGGVNNLPNKRGFNLKNRKSGGTNTPLTQDGVLESGQTTPNTGNNGDEDGEGEVEEEEGVDQAVKGDLELNVPHKDVITYHTPAAPPSLLPAKKYCDITGLHANYTDPRTKLRYKGLDVWHVVRSLGPGSDQAYLALRGAQTSLK